MAGADSRDDDALTAFLDGELGPEEHRAMLERLETDAALGERLARLQAASHGLPQAMSALLEAAPRAGLDAMLDRALASHGQARKPATPRRPFWRGFRLAPAPALAAIVAIAILAGAAGYRVGFEAPRPPEGWHEAVAEYWTLTTKETLALMPPADIAASQLALAGDALGIPLTKAAVTLDGPSFRGAQLYEFNGKPLVQIAYLDPEYGPIAFCVIRNGRKDETTPAATEIDGFHMVHWQGGGFGRMVIGRAPPERLRAFAEHLAAGAGQGA